mmetsp:Transcript_34070/g.54525  ORF Transcript_34070/g.54525 Transcript_34070/m.54525 type:complete len:95 (-) Transcript_34070:985-1269(-)
MDTTVTTTQRVLNSLYNVSKSKKREKSVCALRSKHGFASVELAVTLQRPPRAGFSFVCWLDYEFARQQLQHKYGQRFEQLEHKYGRRFEQLALR